MTDCLLGTFLIPIPEPRSLIPTQEKLDGLVLSILGWFTQLTELSEQGMDLIRTVSVGSAEGGQGVKFVIVLHMHLKTLDSRGLHLWLKIHVSLGRADTWSAMQESFDQGSP